MSFREAVQILEGNEDKPEQVYDRFERPGNWPSIRNKKDKGRPNREEITGRREQRQTTSQMEKRRMEEKDPDSGGERDADASSSYFSPNNSGFLEENGRAKEKESRTQGNINRDYYSQFNLREEDINKEKRGIALQGERVGRDSRGDRGEGTSIGVQIRDEEEMVAALLAAMDKDQNLRARIQEVLKDKSGHLSEEEPRNVGEEERMVHKQGIKEKTRCLQEEERRARERRIVDNIKREFWDKARKESGYFDLKKKKKKNRLKYTKSHS